MDRRLDTTKVEKDTCSDMKIGTRKFLQFDETTKVDFKVLPAELAILEKLTSK